MLLDDIMQQLAKNGLAIFSTADQDGNPHARPIHIGLANEDGIYFMTSPDTHFYQQLMAIPKVAITSYREEDYFIEVIRIEGDVRPVDRAMLDVLLPNHPYIDQVYPNHTDHSSMQVFQCYQGVGFYHSLTQGHRYTFDFKSKQSSRRLIIS